MANSSWLAGNWWQILSALVLFASYVTVLAKAVQTVSQMETRIKDLERKLDEHQLSVSLHRTADFDLRIHNIESGVQTCSTILIQVQTDLGILLKQTS
jgi:hypothetical protein